MPHSQEGIRCSASPPHVSASHSSLARLGALRRGRTGLGGWGETRHCDSGVLRKAPERAARGRAGANQDGQLGVGGTTDVSEPQVLQVRRRALCQAPKHGHVRRCGRVFERGGREPGRAWGATAPVKAPRELQVCRRASPEGLLCASALYLFPPSTGSYRATPTQQRRAALDGVWHLQAAGAGAALQAPPVGATCSSRGPNHSVPLRLLSGEAYQCDADQGRTRRARRKAVRPARGRVGRAASAPFTGAPPPRGAGGAALGGAEHRRRARGGRERRRRVLRLGPQRPRAAGRAGQRRGAARARAHRDPARLGRARDRMRVRPRP